MSREMDTKGKKPAERGNSQRRTESGRTAEHGSSRRHTEARRTEERRNTSASGKKHSAKKSKKRGRTKMVTIAVEIIVLIVLLVALYVLNRTEYFSKVVYDKEKVEHSVNDLAKETLDTMEEYTNIALFGIDTRTPGSLGKGNRSDTIMIASINNKTKDVKLVSVYRDTYLNLANDEYKKCNEAYAFGGPEQAVAMLNMNLDLNIKYYMSVDFLAVSEVVDLIGGVEIDVDEYEIEHLNNYTIETAKVTKKPRKPLKKTGMQLLDGVQATSYCRIRYTKGDDFKRTERQREVLEAIANKAKTLDLKKIDSIVEKVFPMCATNIKVEELLKIAADGMSYNINSTEGFPFDKEAGKIKTAACVIPVDLEENVKKLHEYLFDVKDYVPSEKVVKISNQIKNTTGIGVD